MGDPPLEDPCSCSKDDPMKMIPQAALARIARDTRALREALIVWFKRASCDHRWRWTHGYGWSARKCVKCDKEEFLC